MENAVVIGFGVVGQATAKLFGINKHYDIDETKTNCTLEEAKGSRYNFICLPTATKDGEYELSGLREVIRTLPTGTIAIIRSTVSPGFADSFGTDAVVSNPEFLSEDTAEKDIKYPPFVVIGCKNAKYREEVKALYMNVNKQTKFILTDNITAEAIKLTMNAFFSTKVLFCNQIFDWAQKAGANYEKVREALESHPYGMKNHTKIFYKGQRGVNGKCLPKDLEAFATYTQLPLLGKLVEINNAIEH